MEKLISVEEVLNSRCSCDFDGNPKKNHWGSFIKSRQPSKKVIDSILKCCRKTPQFSNGKLQTWFEDEFMFLGFVKTNDPLKNRSLHIESGMQQQSVYLASTALGVGTCIRNLGINGTEYPDRMATARHQVLEKRASYDSKKFTTAVPGPEKLFGKGRKLPIPRRDGEVECLKSLEQLNSCQNGTSAGETEISQLLWAAKGRTPHYIKSHPWGLTIPTWGGHQNYTSVYLIQGKKLYRYINWAAPRYISWKLEFFPWWIAGNPTHDLRFVKKIEALSSSYVTNTQIILTQNEKTSRALWEVGYMLENLLLQAKSLQVSCKAKVFRPEEIREIEKNGIFGPVAALVL